MGGDWKPPKLTGLLALPNVGVALAVVVVGLANREDVAAVVLAPKANPPKAGGFVVDELVGLVKLNAGLFSLLVDPNKGLDASPLPNEKPVLGVVVPKVPPEVVVVDPKVKLIVY